jgi:hypothetical protein
MNWNPRDAHFKILSFFLQQKFVLYFSISSINKTDRRDITEILLKVALNTITLALINVQNPLDVY